jgi:Acetyltransferase (GNAT) domain
MTPTVVLRSDRLELRMLEASDAEFVESLYANPKVTQTLLQIQRPISIEEAHEFCQVPAAASGAHRLGAALQVGASSSPWAASAATPSRPRCSNDWVLSPPCVLGSGFGTELADLLVEFAAGALGAFEVRAMSLDENRASARVLEKLGFTVLEVGASELDSRGDKRCVTRWVRHRRSRQSSWAAEQQAGAVRLDAGRSA